MSIPLLHVEASNLIEMPFNALARIKRHAIKGTLCRASLNAVIHWKLTHLVIMMITSNNLSFLKNGFMFNRLSSLALCTHGFIFGLPIAVAAISAVIQLIYTENMKEDKLDCKLGAGELEQELFEIHIRPKGTRDLLIIEPVSRNYDANSTVNVIQCENQDKFTLVVTPYILSIVVMCGTLQVHGFANLDNCIEYCIILLTFVYFISSIYIHYSTYKNADDTMDKRHKSMPVSVISSIGEVRPVAWSCIIPYVLGESREIWVRDNKLLSKDLIGRAEDMIEHAENAVSNLNALIIQNSRILDELAANIENQIDACSESIQCSVSRVESSVKQEMVSFRENVDKKIITELRGSIVQINNTINHVITNLKQDMDEKVIAKLCNIIARMEKTELNLIGKALKSLLLKSSNGSSKHVADDMGSKSLSKSEENEEYLHAGDGTSSKSFSNSEENEEYFDAQGSCMLEDGGMGHTGDSFHPDLHNANIGSSGVCSDSKFVPGDPCTVKGRCEVRHEEKEAEEWKQKVITLTERLDKITKALGRPIEQERDSNRNEKIEQREASDIKEQKQDTRNKERDAMKRLLQGKTSKLVYSILEDIKVEAVVDIAGKREIIRSTLRDLGAEVILVGKNGSRRCCEIEGMGIEDKEKNKIDCNQVSITKYLSKTTTSASSGQSR